MQLKPSVHGNFSIYWLITLLKENNMEKNLLSTETVFKSMTDFGAVTVLLGALATLDSVRCELYSRMQFHNT